VSNSGRRDITALLRRAGAGDLDAAGAVLDETLADAWRIAVTAVGCQVRAAEVVTTAYERVWAEQHEDHGIVGARSWVLAVVYRVSRDEVERAA
jgi:DNA-directed RNA polymerase specialized sigma24 family protein